MKTALAAILMAISTLAYAAKPNWNGAYWKDEARAKAKATKFCTETSKCKKCAGKGYVRVPMIKIKDMPSELRNTYSRRENQNNSKTIYFQCEDCLKAIKDNKNRLDAARSEQLRILETARAKSLQLAIANPERFQKGSEALMLQTKTWQGEKLTVLQVIDEKTLLVKVVVTWVQSNAYGRVFNKSREVLAIVETIEPHDYVDGMVFSTMGKYICNGSTSYINTLGAKNTVRKWTQTVDVK